ncbi:MAG TPA: hypothetical protein VMK32_06675 [Burkholderiaceae bacterium]|nr:hypothetical protein [Burkholderiaceae bacterium]
MSARVCSGRLVGVVAAVVGCGCAGYTLQVGTGGFGEFTEVFSVPATSLSPWAGRTAQLPLPPPPTDGGAGNSTLPANRSDLPPDRTPPPPPR